ncbi:MAG: hypothetical protein A3H50_01790 [Candidatus Levybacteria bacterium RIFCSPLOWO2_02_FULL_37_10]|nr:MAG: hypothetical protein A3H50_01790 [Candidatus Levybacteria bacterium RIFCSPLOWO2_02_FULL_37_10]
MAQKRFNWECVSAHGWAGQRYFLFPFLIFKRREKFCGKRGHRRRAGKAKAAAAIPFPLKPLFLAAAADAVNFYEFLIKYVRALL